MRSARRMENFVAKLIDISELRVSTSLVDETIRLLRESGQSGMEAIVLWAGQFLAATTFEVGLVIRPQQTAYRTEEGLLAAVDEEEIFRVNVAVSEQGMRLVAQLHTHPGDAYHSDTDDKHALVTARGAFSIVVPFFATGTFGHDEITVFRLGERNEWRELSSDDVHTTLRIVDNH
jgi:proteasome lid subunit RPN8/RPN11